VKTTHKWLLGLLLLLLPCWSWAMAGQLYGYVVALDENDQTRPIKGVPISMVAGGGSDVSKDNGEFRLTLPHGFGPGAKITLMIEKAGWLIFNPLQGQLFVPASTRQHPIEIRLVPRDSHKLKSPALVRLIAERMLETAKAQITPDSQPKDTDLSGLLTEIANYYAIPPAKLTLNVQQWAEDIQSNQHKYDAETQALAALAKQQFSEAGQLLSRSADIDAAQLEDKLAEVEKLKQAAGRKYRQAADAFYSDYAFIKSLAAYKKALNYVNQQQAPQTWAAIQGEMGNAHSQQGIRTSGADIEKHLKMAVAAYQAALTVYTREQLPPQWATTQNNLGIVLKNQGTRTGGEASATLLGEAVAAYRAALTVYTREQLPPQWATTQNNLGIVLGYQGTRTGGEASAALFKKALFAYEAALEVRRPESLPYDWQQTQMNLIRLHAEMENIAQLIKRCTELLSVIPDNPSCQRILQRVKPSQQPATKSETFVDNTSP